MEDPLVAQFQKEQEQDDYPERGRNSESGDDDSENDDDHGDEVDGNSAQPLSTASYPTRQMGPQTGPKGVVADHAFFEKTQREAQAQARADYNSRVLAKAPTTTTYLQDEAAKELVLQTPTEDEDEDAAIRRYREKRLRELKREGQRRDERVFGQVFDIDGDDYATTIDMECKGVSVLVHLYDESIPACKKLDEFWLSLARKYALAKFVRVSAIELDFDLVESPAVLGYKDGNLIANLVRFVDHVGAQFTPETVEEALLGNGALGHSDVYRADD